RRVDADSGVITTVAGQGYGLVGDGGAATSEALTDPTAVAVDSFGNRYIAEAFGSRITRVDAAGTITTVAGTGQQSFSGDGGPAIFAVVNGPNDVAVDDQGNVYIADTGNNRIRRVDTSGTITTIAGNGTLGFSGDGGPLPATFAQLRKPSGIAVDGAHNIF